MTRPIRRGYPWPPHGNVLLPRGRCGYVRPLWVWYHSRPRWYVDSMNMTVHLPAKTRQE